MTIDLTAENLRALTSCGGCAAKADSALLKSLRVAAVGCEHSDTIIGLAQPDDAAVVEINETTSLITTVDFFPPVVSNAFDYGYVSALNALSDIYAMGGTPRTALLICGFPSDMSETDMVACVTGAKAACVESDVEIVGGHTVRVSEAVFGLAATGYVHPKAIWRKSGMRPGDVLMLSKPLGTGVLLATRELVDEHAALTQMRISNKAARDVLATCGDKVHAVTDVTGFGLIGHISEMLGGQDLDVHLSLSKIAVLPEAMDLFEAGIRTSADVRNRFSSDLATSGLSGHFSEAALFDPQTNGGLLASVSPGLQQELENQGFFTVGKILTGSCVVHVAINEFCNI
ncbi:MAG: selenide, water dikinase SelD [Actinomycetes bacterium]